MRQQNTKGSQGPDLGLHRVEGEEELHSFPPGGSSRRQAARHRQAIMRFSQGNGQQGYLRMVQTWAFYHTGTDSRTKIGPSCCQPCSVTWALKDSSYGQHLSCCWRASGWQLLIWVLLLGSLSPTPSHSSLLKNCYEIWYRNRNTRNNLNENWVLTVS